MDNQQRSQMSQMKSARAAETTGTTGNGTFESLVSQAPDRVSLIISSDGSAAVFLRRVKAGGGEAGITLTTSRPFIKLTLAEHGSIVQGPIYARGDGAAVPMVVWEAFDCPCQY